MGWKSLSANTWLTEAGIGYEALKVFLNAAKPYHIIAAARTSESASKAIASVKEECPNTKNTIEPLALELSSDQSIEEAYAQVTKSPGRLDVLINNAGKHILTCAA